MIFTKCIEMPIRVRGFTIRDVNGDYYVYINALLNRAGQQDAHKHEMDHILSGDFDQRCGADLIEFFAHGGFA